MNIFKHNRILMFNQQNYFYHMFVKLLILPQSNRYTCRKTENHQIFMELAYQKKKKPSNFIMTCYNRSLIIINIVS